jgi:hypothetical protein
MGMDTLFFVGYDIDQPLPWHSTLSWTRQHYGDDLFNFTRGFKQQKPDN